MPRPFLSKAPMKRLIWRAAEIAGDPSALPQQITIAELPSLSKTIANS
jgi:hypothetical protein